MAAATVQLKGYKETMRALERVQRGAGKRVLAGLALSAEPVRQDWISRLNRYEGVSTGTIGPKVLTKGVLVTQRARKVTGKRGDFGGIQMRHGLEALFSKQDETVKAVETALDTLTREEGF